MTIRVWAVVAVAATVVAVLAAGCSLPTDDEARGVSDAALPDGLRADPTTSTTVPVSVVPVPPVDVTLWFVDGETQLLVPTVRPQIDRPVPLAVMRALVEGPTEEEAQQGLTSGIPPGIEVNETLIQRRVLTVDLSSEFFDATGDVFRRAVAQIVFTGVGLEGIDSVRFQADGADRVVPIGASGVAEDRPVTRRDYPDFDPDEVTLDGGDDAAGR